jgi:hypothetical protein
MTRQYFPTEAEARAELERMGYQPNACQDGWYHHRSAPCEAELRYNSKGYWVEERA